VEHIMGTAIAFDVRDVGGAEHAIDEAATYLRWVDDVFSTHRDTSEMAGIRRGDLSVSDADPTVREVLAACDRLREATAGAFDHRCGRRLDPSGYVKGWAVEGAAAILAGCGAGTFLISAGGDIVARGAPPGRSAWRIGIRDPEDGRSVIGSVEVGDGAIATSGRYERGDHIWGVTGEPPASVSVIGPDLGIADALATAVFASWPPADWLGHFPGYDLIVVTSDRRVLRSPTARFTTAAVCRR
jgi:thiamine biosynthesis lipoprotein